MVTNVLCELTYRSYRANRLRSPWIVPARWAAIFPEWWRYEKRLNQEAYSGR